MADDRVGDAIRAEIEAARRRRRCKVAGCHSIDTEGFGYCAKHETPEVRRKLAARRR